MRIIKNSKGYKLIVEYVEDLVGAKQILSKGTVVTVIDYRRQNSTLDKLDETRGERRLTSINMEILQTKFELDSLIVHGQTEGSSFHNYRLGKSNFIVVHRKPSALEKKILDFANSIKGVYMVIIDDSEYSIILLKDYNYDIINRGQLTYTEDLCKTLTPVISKLDLNEEYIIISNYVIFEQIKKINSRLKCILYSANIPVWHVIDKVNFFRSNEFNRLKSFTNMHEEQKIYLQIHKAHLINHEQIELYASLNLIVCIYASIAMLDQIDLSKYSKFNCIILSEKFSAVYDVPSVFATVKYLIKDYV